MKTQNLQSNSRFLIAATSSGSGKTTLTLGLLRAMQRRGMNVQPFKCGPDYIDTQFHEVACDKASVNLDSFFCSDEHLKALFCRYRSGADVCLIEGVMGMFDGYDRMRGSSAEIAALLDIPVILVLNASSMAYSAAAILYGFKNLMPSAKVIGVVFNFVSSEEHYHYLKQACVDVGVESLGYLPNNTDLEIPSRHLGLTLDKNFCLDHFMDRAAAAVEKYVRIDRLLELTKSDYLPCCEDGGVSNLSDNEKPLRIAVARDDAFNFMYTENIQYLQRLGEVSFFSPLTDVSLPLADFVYLPGGYPELFLAQLSANASMMKSIRSYCEGGGKLFAECGGMMYLCQSITDKEGNVYPMVGIFNEKATMEGMHLRLGYRCFEYGGMKLRGHEFHFSSIDGTETSVAQQYSATDRAVDTKLMRYKNTLAGYTHVYWAENSDWMNLFNEETK